jgi:16S rRNA (cytosine967-C5)-methyltransferase
VLLPENRDQVGAFIARFPEFSIVPWAPLWEQAAFSAAPPQSAEGSAETLLMTPRGFGTDGFFVAMLQRK